ncbi:MAG: hypothetical protein COA66_04680 [Arcobacter sp.]|nr:MAG: hypothetical protein COA66_04680 [Arcobacter sp.]
MYLKYLVYFILAVFFTACSNKFDLVNSHETKKYKVCQSDEERNKCELCQNDKEKKKYELYQIYIDADGNLLSPKTGKIEAEVQEEAYIENIYKNFKKMKENNSDLTLTIFIHGGLNNFTSSINKVKTHTCKMLIDNKYPLFISWDSSSLSNYSDHLFLLRRGIKSETLGPISSPFVLLEDILRAIIRIPVSTYNVLFSQNTIFKSLSTEEEKDSEDKVKILKEKTLVNVHDHLPSKGLSSSDWLTVWNPVKLITAPFVDALGTGAWDSMLRRTDLILKKDVSKNDFKATAVDKFFSEYGKELGEINLIGHSMGAIVTNNIISKYSEIKFKNIVHMAAASRLKDLELVIVPYLKENPRANFYNLSLSPYSDLSENFYLDFAPRGSLLVWIDQTLGKVNSFSDRTAGYWFNITRSAHKIFKDKDKDKDKDKNIQKRVHLTRFGLRDTSPQKHGDFSKCDFWNKDFWTAKIQCRKKE